MEEKAKRVAEALNTLYGVPAYSPSNYGIHCSQPGGGFNIELEDAIDTLELRLELLKKRLPEIERILLEIRQQQSEAADERLHRTSELCRK